MDLLPLGQQGWLTVACNKPVCFTPPQLALFSRNQASLRCQLRVALFSIVSAGLELLQRAGGLEFAQKWRTRGIGALPSSRGKSEASLREHSACKRGNLAESCNPTDIMCREYVRSLLKTAGL